MAGPVDYAAIATALRTLADQAEQAALNVGMGDAGLGRNRGQEANWEAVLNSIQDMKRSLRQEMRASFRIVERTMDRDRINGEARLHNSHVGLRQPLQPLVSTSCESIPGFPETAEALERLPDNELSRLLKALGESDEGAPYEKKRRLQRVVGIRWAWTDSLHDPSLLRQPELL